jgi:hypothetical protein
VDSKDDSELKLWVGNPSDVNDMRIYKNVMEQAQAIKHGGALPVQMATLHEFGWVGVTGW